MLRNIRQPAVLANFGASSNVTNTVLGTPLTITNGRISTSTSTGALIVAGGVGVAGNIHAENIIASGITGVIQTSNQPLITEIGLQSALTAVNLTVTGNLTLLGNTTSVASNNTYVTNALFDIHTGAGGGELITDDGQDLGLIINYYKSSASRRAFVGFDNQTQRLVFLTDANVASGQVTGTAGTLEIGNLIVSAVPVT
jgi:hypothetical protein